MEYLVFWEHEMALVTLRGDSLTHSKLYKQTHMKSYMTSKECSENTSIQQNYN